jgi:hypothetical protein
VVTSPPYWTLKRYNEHADHRVVTVEWDRRGEGKHRALFFIRLQEGQSQDRGQQLKAGVAIPRRGVAGTTEGGEGSPMPAFTCYFDFGH